MLFFRLILNVFNYLSLIVLTVTQNETEAQLTIEGKTKCKYVCVFVYLQHLEIPWHVV